MASLLYLCVNISVFAWLKISYIYGPNEQMCNKHFCFIPLQRNSHWNPCFFLICFFYCDSVSGLSVGHGYLSMAVLFSSIEATLIEEQQ